MKTKKKSITLFSNGATARLHNRRVSFIEIKKDETPAILLRFDFADSEPDKPACGHKCIGGKIRQTTMLVNEEAMDALVQSYISFKRAKSCK